MLAVITSAPKSINHTFRLCMTAVLFCLLHIPASPISQQYPTCAVARAVTELWSM
jgi:hypothetical protein